MPSRFAIAALTALLPLSAMAQSIVLDSGAEPDRQAVLDSLLQSAAVSESGRYVPMWSTPDGRILVAVAHSSPLPSPIAPASPQFGGALDWRLIDATSVLDGQVGVRLGEQTRLNAGIGLTPLLLGEPGADCAAQSYAGVGLAGTCEDPAGLRPSAAGNWFSGNLGAHWSNTRFGLDLGLALSWLEPALPRSLMPALSAHVPVAAPLAASALPRLVIPATSLDRFNDSTQFGARGRWYFSPKQSIDLGASIGRIRLSPDPSGERPGWQQTALSLGVGSSALSTSITGRFHNPLRTATPTQSWTGIDLGLTWHTPWQADLSIGAQNLWSSPPLTGSDANDQARTPYVQYQQDL